MKYTFLAIIAVLSLNSCGQNNNKEEQPGLKNEAQQKKTDPAALDTSIVRVDSANSATTEYLVLNIRKEYQRVNALHLIATKKSFICDTDGTITYYKYNGKVVKIVIDWGFVGDGST